MDYVIDIYQERNESNGIVEYPSFIYDDSRFYSKLYVFLKLLGLIIYTLTLPRCNSNYFFITMIIVMFLSTMNSIRYEYNHFKRNGTIFSSIHEFEIWKKELWPKSRIFFSTAELSIKIGFFITIFPPRFEFISACDVGESIFKIHILVLLSTYIISGVFCICLLSSSIFYNFSNESIVTQTINVSFPNSVIVTNNKNEECCICLDTNNTELWSMLRCGHKFHSSCISTWLHTHKTCPICRVDIITIF